MNFKHFILTLLLTPLTACGPNVTVLGEIDKDLLITKEEIHAMGYETFFKEYLGKEITITDLNPLGKSGEYNDEKGQCVIGYNGTVYRNGQYDTKNRILAIIYSNHTPIHALKQRLVEGSYTEESLQYEQEIDLPLSVCDVCDWNPENKSCFTDSPNTIITGKIIQIGQSDDMIGFVLKPKGLAY